MNTSAIIEQIEAEIERLRKVKALLEANPVPARRGRPPGSGNKRTFSAEARARMAAAQRKRWEKAKKAF